MVYHVAVLIAMEDEAMPFVNHLELKEIKTTNEKLPMRVFQGPHGDGMVSVVINGKDKTFGVDCVGTTPATLSTFYIIEHLKPDIIINAGTAGGFRRHGAGIGDAYMCTIAYHHDRRIQIPGFDVYGDGGYKFHPCPSVVATMDLKQGIITTSNSLDHVPADDEKMEKNGAVVKDMEAASIAWVCQTLGVPLLALKVVTDIVDGEHPTHEEFLQNLGKASVSLQEKLPKVLDLVLGKSLDDL